MIKYTITVTVVFNLQWLLDDFLGYIKEWEDDIAASNFSEAEKPLMCLSAETLEGLKIIGTYNTYTLTL